MEHSHATFPSLGIIFECGCTTLLEVLYQHVSRHEQFLKAFVVPMLTYWFLHIQLYDDEGVSAKSKTLD